MSYVMQRVWNVLRAGLQTRGNESIKRSIWNAEFSKGRWACLDHSPGDPVYRYIERYANHGSILDLGCGSGNTATELNAAEYHDYTGVDVSDVAIEMARARLKPSHAIGTIRYIRNDIYRYIPSQTFTVILFRDSIYYIPPAKIRGLLERYSQYLARDGVFIARLWQTTGRHQFIVETIKRAFEIVELYRTGEASTAVIVFRPPRGVGSAEAGQSGLD
ncbi:MAG: class I SAM-dependent methyltransferase [Acidobacteriia bacterium]|nr:class I SAM-dependent methyltransferase [Terriglobia bacterium]